MALEFIDGVGPYAKTNTNTQPRSSGGERAGDVDSPVDSVFRGSYGSTVPSGDKPRSGELESPCNVEM